MSETITLVGRTQETSSADPVPSRPARPEDVPALAELFYAAYDRDVVESPEAAKRIIQGAFDGEYGPFLADASPVIEDEDGAVVAAALVLEHRTGENLPGVPYIFELFTAASYRRRGLGEQLVREALSKLHQQGYDEVSLRIAEDNSAALALYLTLDFHRWSPDHDDV